MGSHRVLYVIDDDSDDQDYLMELLHEIDPDIVCVTAANGQEALLKLHAAAIPSPSLIFLDLNMPRVDGKRFLFEIKNDPVHQNIPVIMYTTSSSRQDIEDTRLLGASGYIIKTDDYDGLKQQLAALLDAWVHS